MTQLTNGHLHESRSDHDVQKQLRDLKAEHRDTMEALNHAEASIARARKLNDLNYHRRRKAILSNGHDAPLSRHDDQDL